MNIQDVNIGLLCNSKKGSGKVAWIQADTRHQHMTDVSDNHHFEDPIEDVTEDPQIPHKEDAYY
ncbi:hypothetical protein [Algicola sagamiensis]|uniref:hypothetical protein n=1 Tax=Algicola sagamiensis TaxID=163869 RepID=UPI00039B1E04|nr:hypothetical protein [Algicola sagamiensis]